MRAGEPAALRLRQTRVTYSRAGRNRRWQHGDDPLLGAGCSVYPLSPSLCALVARGPFVLARGCGCGFMGFVLLATLVCFFCGEGLCRELCDYRCWAA